MTTRISEQELRDIKELFKYECEMGLNFIRTSDSITTKLLSEIETLRGEINDLTEVVFDIFSQACCCNINEYKFDHQCISTYEAAQDKLILLGKIKKEDCIRD